MAMIEILQYPDPRLRKKAKTVVDVKDAKLQKIIDDMFETLYKTPNCAGLAATQLAIADPYRVTVIDVSPDKNQPLCLINPEIIAAEGEVVQLEGCMSVYPDEIHGQVTRAEKIKARALDREGKPLEIEATELLAKCIQHEIDHLNGKLYIDHLSPLKKQMIDKKIAKFRRRAEDA
jgi:peptide deformylase